MSGIDPAVLLQMLHDAEVRRIAAETRAEQAEALVLRLERRLARGESVKNSSQSTE